MGKKLNFFYSLGMAEILGLSELSVYIEAVPLKTFPQHLILNYASTENIEEDMKFYNLSDKTFETDFNTQKLNCICQELDPTHLLSHLCPPRGYLPHFQGRWKEYKIG